MRRLLTEVALRVLSSKFKRSRSPSNRATTCNSAFTFPDGLLYDMPFAFRNQPLKTAYTAGGVVYVLAALPVWLVLDAMPAARPRKSWPMKRAILARVFRTVIDMMFQTSLPAPTPLSTYEQKGSSLGFVWVEAAPELVVGEVAEIAEKNGVKPERTGGFWYGPRDANGGVGQRASPGERVVYHLHGTYPTVVIKFLFVPN